MEKFIIKHDWLGYVASNELNPEFSFLVKNAYIFDSFTEASDFLKRYFIQKKSESSREYFAIIKDNTSK